MEPTTAKQNGVSTLLDEVQEARTEVCRSLGGQIEDQLPSWKAVTEVAVAYVLGRRNMPLSETPRVRHLLELRERGHAV